MIHGVSVKPFLFAMPLLLLVASDPSVPTQQLIATTDSDPMIETTTAAPTIRQDGNDFVALDSSGKRLFSIHYSVEDYGNLSKRYTDGQIERIKCGNPFFATDTTLAMFKYTDSKNKGSSNLGNAFAPSKCRSNFVKKIMDVTLEMPIQAAVIVTNSECKNMQIWATGMCRQFLNLDCGMINGFRYNVAAIPLGQKARFKYSGQRGWNMWGNSNWTECTDTNKVVNMGCNDVTPKESSNACFEKNKDN